MGLLWRPSSFRDTQKSATLIFLPSKARRRRRRRRQSRRDSILRFDAFSTNNIQKRGALIIIIIIIIENNSATTTTLTTTTLTTRPRASSRHAWCAWSNARSFSSRRVQREPRDGEHKHSTIG